MPMFQIIALTPPGLAEPSIAIAASRAGAIGILALQYTQAPDVALSAIGKLARFAKGDYGVKLDSQATKFLSAIIPKLPASLKYVILTSHQGAPENLIHTLQQQGRTVYLETTALEQAKRGEQIGVDGVIAKGHESGGYVGEETTFILLQQYIRDLSLPIFAHGGIGQHTAAACRIAGAAGVVLDAQFALAKESTLPSTLKDKLIRLDGSETICVGELLGARYRVYSRPDCRAVASLREEETELIAAELPAEDALKRWQQQVHRRIGWDSAEQNLLLLGQDTAFAVPLAKQYRTVGGIIEGIRQTSLENCKRAARLRSFDVDAPLAKAHGTRYPIVQGPMTRVSDIPAFAKAVADGGGLPFLALALMRKDAVQKLLSETQRLLGAQPWGVGLLGFVPLELRAEQLEVIQRYKPPFALIAGGHPEQARVLEGEGIATYLHVPSPDLLKMFLKAGARRFVFEGRECGGHVGPRSSFVLWESLINVLLEHLEDNTDASQFHLLFAGGIHDAVSAAMVAAMAAPLAERGVCIGTLVGTGYMFTEEAVTTGAIVKGFQEQMIGCKRTVLLETGLGHATRCAQTPYTEFFEHERLRLHKASRDTAAIRDELESLNLGRLRIASKGIQRHPEYGVNPNVPPFIPVEEAEQKAQGMYMIGQVAVMRDSACTIEQLHHAIAVGSTQRLQTVSAGYQESVDHHASRPSDIAIIGIAALFPKAQDVQTYWENILNKVNAIIEVPKERWNLELYYHPDAKVPDKSYSKWGAFLDDIVFEPTKYGMPPNTLPSIEPMQLLALEVANTALEDAGYAAERAFPRERTSVFFGAGGAGDLVLDYGFRSLLPHYLELILPHYIKLLQLHDPQRMQDAAAAAQDILENLGDALPEWTEDSFPGVLLNVTAGRITNRLNLGGTNFTVDAACASSLAAIALGVKELETGEADMVIAGGADTTQNPYAYICFSETHALSPTGETRTFDETADGIVLGEGVAAVILKRLSDAERDGDRIYAVIKAVGSSSDGRGKGLTTPHPTGQVRVLNRAYAKAGFSPATVGLIEAHGTGTVVGDRTEIESLKQVFDTAGATRQACAIGSVKTMVGHTKCTAGAAGLIKSALALYHKVLPPTLGVKTPNSKANFPQSPFYINTETRPWMAPLDEHPRRAGASAFGFGGTNFHLVLEEYTDAYLNRDAFPIHRLPTELVLLRRDSRQALMDAIADVERQLARNPQFDLKDLAYTIHQLENKAPVSAPLTLALIATSTADLSQKLAQAKGLLANPQHTSINDPHGIYFSETPMMSAGKLAFLFPGQASQYVNMLKDLAVFFPEVRQHFERADVALKEKLPQPLSSYIFPRPAFGEAEARTQHHALMETNVAQPAIGVANMAMFHLLAKFGVQADLMAGHSYGEYAALCAAGVFDFETLIRLSEARGRFIAESSGSEPGAMAAVEADAERVSEVIREIAGVSIASRNAPRQTIITGGQSGIENAAERFRARQMRITQLPVACAFHSEHLADAQGHLADWLKKVEICPPQVEVFSNTTASPYPHEKHAIADQLVVHLVQPVQFVRQVEQMYDAGTRIFVEVGPGNVLAGLTDRILSDSPRLVLSSVHSKRHGVTQLQHLLAQLAAHGVPVKLSRFYEGRCLDARIAEDGQHLVVQMEPSKPSKTAWLVNGNRAKPITMKPKVEGRRIREVGETRKQGEEETLSGQAPKVSSSIQLPPINADTPIEHPPNQPSHNPFPADSQPPPVRSSGVEGISQNLENAAPVMAQFQQVMNRFLETQRNVMLTYLQTNSGDAEIPSPEPHPTENAPGDGSAEATSIFRPPHVDTSAETTSEPQDESARPVIRYILRAWDTPLRDAKTCTTLAASGVVIITDDGRGVAARLADELCQLGYRAILVRHLAQSVPRFVEADSVCNAGTPENTPTPGYYTADLTSFESVSMLAQAVAKTHGGIVGLIHLLPLRERDQFDPMKGGLKAWQTALNLDVKSLFYLAKVFGQDLNEAADNGEASVLAVSALGGDFALSKTSHDNTAFFPGQGGIAGLTKTLAHEWPNVRVRVVDVSPQMLVENREQLSTLLMREMHGDDTQPEVGYVGEPDRRVRLYPVETPLEMNTKRVKIDHSSVLLITGGARGITAEVARELAKRYQPTLLLVGRSPLPPDSEPPELAVLSSPQELKAELIARACQQGQTVTPAIVEKAYLRLCKDREIRHNIEAMKAAGAQVHYFSVDVCDEHTFSHLIDEIYQTYGRIDGVLHGAGIIEDKLIRDKSPGAFDRVFDTKVSSAFLLSHKLRPESLRFFVLFSSVAGRFGNRGQADYAAANEVYDKLAIWLNTRWQGRVVSVIWGPWQPSRHTVGMVSPELEKQLVQRGIPLVSRSVGPRKLIEEIEFGNKSDAVVILGGGV